MVFVLAIGGEVCPSAFLLLEIETSGVWEEEEGDDHSGKTEPWDEVEFLLGADVVVKDGGEEGTHLSNGSGESVSSRSDRSWENFGSNEESDGVGSKLVEKGGEEVHGLEGVNTVNTAVILVVESWDDEHDETHEETELLHILATVELVVDEERGQVVTGERDTNVNQVPEPSRHDVTRLVGCGVNDLDECALEQLVSVEEDVVAEPSTGGTDETRTKVLERHLQRLNIVPGDVGPLLGHVEGLGCEWHLVPSVVDEPEGTDSWDGERDTEGPLSGNL